MNRNIKLTQEIVRELLHYDPETGLLFWKERDMCWFEPSISRQRICNAWNAKHRNKEALISLNRNGYKHGPILGNYYLNHRIVWLWNKGFYPEKQLDHIDGNILNNNVLNLREVDNSENHKNMSLGIKNTSGYLGVSFYNRTKQWTARITIQGKVVSLGYFYKKEDAVNARKLAEIEHKFHPNHGRKKEID